MIHHYRYDRVLMVLVLLMLALESGRGQITSEQMVDLQIEAYNNKQLDQFLEVYSEQVQIFNFPDELLVSDKESLRSQYQIMFKSFPELQCTVYRRSRLGTQTIIDWQTIQGFPEGGVLENMVIYKIKSNKIVKVYLVNL